MAAAWESAMGLPPKGTAVESTAAAWVAGDDEIWIGAGRGRVALTSPGATTPPPHLG
jgi:hypothetical protein